MCSVPHRDLMHPSGLPLLCVSNSACQIACYELALNTTLPFRSPEQLERFYLPVPASKMCGWQVSACSWGDVTIQQLPHGYDLESSAQ